MSESKPNAADRPSTLHSQDGANSAETRAAAPGALRALAQGVISRRDDFADGGMTRAEFEQAIDYHRPSKSWLWRQLASIGALPMALNGMRMPFRIWCEACGSLRQLSVGSIKGPSQVNWARIAIEGHAAKHVSEAPAATVKLLNMREADDLAAEDTQPVDGVAGKPVLKRVDFALYTHKRPKDGRDCDYMAHAACNKCGWVESKKESP